MTQSICSIPLGNGFVAVVSAEDLPELSKFTWHTCYRPSTRSWFAVRYTRVAGKKVTVIMARQILGLAPDDPRQADHENHDTLCNTRDNIRIATPMQNCQNRRRRTDNTSGFKGVSWNSRACKAGKWRAQITFNGKTLCVGNYTDRVEAAHAYDAKARELFGPFALCNFPLAADTFVLPHAA
jgi:hypothetical protein